MREVVIIGAARTPVGSFQGVLSEVPATRLGSIAIEEALKRAKVSPEEVQQCIMGCVLPAGLGQAPARQAALGAKLPKSVDCMTVNKVCGSGLKSVMLAFDAIRVGEADVIVAGGMESMTRAPYALDKARGGYRMGDGKISDLMIKDGLWDAYNDFHMGNAAELCAEKYEFTRQMQDAFGIESFKRAQRAQKEGLFKEEIVPVTIPQKKGDPIVVSDDEGPGRAKFDKIPKLPPAFKKDGTVTAANASSINDGAAAVVVTSAEFAKKKGVEPLARIIAYSSASREPEWFTVAPADAMQKLFDKTKVAPADVDLYEINEAFAVVTMAANRTFGLDPAKVNINGGAVALGHPIGASGARIFVTLLYAMKQRKAKRGLATLCIGGGEAVAVMVER
ncbi:MAG: acetyl-CoA C-acetyltransferase [Candidatus Abyssobacteria bacterium SURF_17]|uniref:Acetyl-CoA C-acetyltransferase n=1 Tax=Candidatus Abyssobacteria bacterium SURF_17 TaxID=2093361 RepID=A0A419EV60_9BACT|nr:MAG: acetyl-CoA C-acetyltransferase [Candidatus Abyssubacteria bacterium SURF_17]